MANYSSFHRNIIINILFQSSGKMQGDIISKLRIMTKISYTESKPHEKKYVVAWNPLITEPPFPGMHLDIGLCRWIPDDIEDFAAKYGAEFDEVVSKYKIDSGTQKANLPRKEIKDRFRCNRNPGVPLHQVNRHNRKSQRRQQPRNISLLRWIIQSQKRRMKFRCQTR